MKLVAAVFLVFCTVMAAQTREEQMASLSAERWMSLCEPIANAAMDAKGNLSVDGSFKSGECFGAFEALQVLSGLQDKGRPVLGICFPPASLRTQQVRIFVEYAKRHPERSAEPFAYVAVAALSEAFPCRSK